MQTAENFTRSFHNLEGVTLGEKKESLNKLLKTYSPSEIEGIIDLTSIEPKTYLESIFKIDALIYFHKTTELLEVFKGGNDIFISKIIKQPWFVKEVFSRLDAKQLVNEYLPQLSFSVRMKVLKKIVNIMEESVVDDVFDCLIERYGLFIATTVLPSCSRIKINSVLKDYHIKLSTGQLKKLFNKDPELILTYLEEYKIHSNKEFEDQKLLTFIAKKAPEYFWKLCENYNCIVTLGNKTTKKMLVMREDKLVDNPGKYVKYFRQDKMVRILGKKNLFKKLYQHAFPKTKLDIETANDDSVLYKQLLKYYPKHGQYFLFESTFETIIGDSIWNNIKCLDNNLLVPLKDINIRESLAQEKYKETRDVQYLKYFKTQKSLADIKEKINATSSAVERANLIELLIETCHLNNDLVALENVLKYFITRHKHDDRVTRKSCLTKILEKYGDQLDEFNETHWTSLNDIIAIQKLNNEYLWNVKKLEIKYMEFLFKNNQPIEKHINQFLKGLSSVYPGGAFDNMSYIKNPEFERKVYQYLTELLPTLKSRATDKKDFIFEAAILNYDVYNHNIKNPNHKIDIFENETFQTYLVDACKLEAIHYYTADVVGKLICKTNRNAFEEELVPIYFLDTFNKCVYNRRVIKWFVNYDPQTLEKYAEYLIKDYISFSALNINKIKKYHHVGLDKKIIEACKDELSNETVRVDLKIRICKILSHLVSTEEYLEYCTEKLPKPTTKLNLNSEEETIKYTIGRELIKNLRYMSEPQKALPLILQYCTSDYLQTTLPALYTAFYKSPENVLSISLNELIQKQTNSISKHAIFLSSMVSTKSQNLALFKSFLTNTNDEIHKNLVRSSLKYFVRNPCSETFEIAIEFLKNVQSTDDESFQLITKLRFPKTYKTAVIIKCWDVFENLRKTDTKNPVKYNKYQFKLINSLDIELGNEEFCKQVIQEYFLKTDDSGISEFVIKFLSVPTSEKENYFKFVFDVVAAFKLQYWSQNSNRNQFLHIFFYAFYKSIQQKDADSTANNSTATYFVKHWTHIFSPTEAFDEYILLNLMLLNKHDTKSFEICGKTMCQFFSEVFEEHGGTTLNIVSENVSIFLDSVPLSQKVHLYYMILKENENVTSDLIFILVIILMRTIDKSSLDVEGEMHQSKIESILSKVSNNTVKLHYNLYLKHKKQQKTRD